MAAKRTAGPQVASQVFERSKEVFDTVASETEDLYHTARAWVPDNYGKLAVFSSAAIGVCLLGYVSGKRAQRRQVLEPAKAGPVPEIDFAPFVRFLKLWMVYRIATKG
jgi:hypothetical protein